MQFLNKNSTQLGCFYFSLARVESYLVVVAEENGTSPQELTNFCGFTFIKKLQLSADRAPKITNYCK